MTPDVLLAKSRRQGKAQLTLEQHCKDTEEAARLLFDLDRRWGRNWCRFFKLQGAARERFLLHARVAGLFHDIGKANEEFYAMVCGRKDVEQTLRHEHLSALILHLDEMRDWLAHNPALDHDVLVAAVLSHHLKAAEKEGEYWWGRPRAAAYLTHFLDHAEVRALLARVAEVASLPAPPSLPLARWSANPPWVDALGRGLKAASRFRRALKSDQDPERRALLLATKAALMVSDAAASGLRREEIVFRSWIDDHAHLPRVTAAELETSIVAPRTSSIEEATGTRFVFQNFQKGAAVQGPRVLLLAACGSGKTLAAWKWAQVQAETHEIGKVVFLYPTRGTATEGFRDYVAWAPESDAALMHGTARYELDGIATNPDDVAAKGKRFAPTEAEERLYALGFWSKRFFSATIDQFLSFMEHGYGGMCLLPVLADSALIVDEVHSFDERAFANLIGFLKHFEGPVLCMTATLPRDRREQLQRAGLTVYPREEHRAELRDLDVEESAPRYRLTPVADAREARVIALRAYAEGKRVLWVVNTVARCQSLARELSDALGAPPDALHADVLCYHSRYKLEHRKERHAAAVRAFKRAAPACIGVTTQVCEMSLDLDADVLITEHAPTTSLVQRFGRSHRKRGAFGRSEEFRAQLVTYPPESARPYERVDLALAAQFLTALGEGDISQRDLAQRLEAFTRPEADADDAARFVTSGYFATPGSLRDIEEHTESCVLDSDDELARVHEAVLGREHLEPLLVPAPRKQLSTRDRPVWLPKWLHLAPADQYCAALGFRSNRGGNS